MATKYLKFAYKTSKSDTQTIFNAMVFVFDALKLSKMAQEFIWGGCLSRFL